MPDVFAVLTEDHRKVESLFSQFEQTGDPETALAICRELTIHALVEEEMVYPVLANKVGTRLADEARREHNEAKVLISQIESGVGRGDDVSALVQQLQRDVQHHVHEEESELFPKMESEFPKMTGTMGEEVVRRKEALQAQMREAEDVSQPPSSVGNKATTAPGSVRGPAAGA
jgi:hemerythrin superfamily protein